MSLKQIFGSLAGILLLVGCASSSVPTRRLASAQAAVRAADEVGADRNPRAALHLRLAREQLGLARTLTRDGDNERAAIMFRRAQMDAELALQITRQSAASTRAANVETRARGMESGVR